MTTNYANVAYDLLLYNMESATLAIESNSKLSHCRLMYLDQVLSGESKPERIGTPFRCPKKPLKGVPGPPNVRIFTGTLDSSPFWVPMHYNYPTPYTCPLPVKSD